MEEYQHISNIMIQKMSEKSQIHGMDYMENNQTLINTHVMHSIKYFPYFEYSHPSAFGNFKTAYAITKSLKNEKLETFPAPSHSDFHMKECPLVFPPGLKNATLKTNGRKLGFLTHSNKESIRYRKANLAAVNIKSLTFICNKENCLESIILKNDDSRIKSISENNIISKKACGDLNFIYVNKTLKQSSAEYIKNSNHELYQALFPKNDASFLLFTPAPESEVDLGKEKYPLQLELTFYGDKNLEMEFGILNL
jgi:hypothetical protein